MSHTISFDDVFAGLTLQQKISLGFNPEFGSSSDPLQAWFSQYEHLMPADLLKGTGVYQGFWRNLLVMQQELEKLSNQAAADSLATLKQYIADNSESDWPQIPLNRPARYQMLMPVKGASA